jgi:hypothetical protein
VLRERGADESLVVCVLVAQCAENILLYRRLFFFIMSWGSSANEDNKQMRGVTFFLVALDMTLAAVAPTEAAHHKAQTRHHLVKMEPQPVRVCDWVGPGGRAVYRCTYIQPQQQSFLEPRNDPTRRTCDWIGPGGRAVYRCQ